MKNHVKVAHKALSGQTQVDEQVLESMAVLNERLERIRSFGGKFAHISFSSAAQKIASSSKVMAV